MTATTGSGDSGELKGHLGVFTVIVMVIAAAAPLTTVGAVAPAAIIVGNGPAFPIMYVVAALILALFVVGFNAMTRFVKEAGAFYSYTTLGLGRGMGMTAAYIALLTYTCVQVAVIAFLGAVVEGQVVSLGGPDLPWWFWTGVFLVLVTILGYRNIDFSGRVLAVLVTLEIAICLILVLAVVFKGGSDEGLSTAAFQPSRWFDGAPALGLMFGVSGFLGFEAAAIYRDEARDPDRTISRATYGALAVIGIFYGLVAWGMVSAWGDDSVVAKASEDPGSLLGASFGRYLGSTSQDIVQWLLITSFFACVLSFHNVINRYLHALAHKHLMPAALGRTHPKHNSPYVAAVTQSICVGLIVVVAVLLGLGPFSQIFTWMVGVSTLGFLLLMLLTCLAVLAFFRSDRRGLGRWRTQIAPALGVVALGIGVITTTWNLEVLVGTRTLAISAVVPVLVILALGPVLAMLRPDLNADVDQASKPLAGAG